MCHQRFHKITLAVLVLALLATPRVLLAASARAQNGETPGGLFAEITAPHDYSTPGASTGIRSRFVSVDWNQLLTSQVDTLTLNLFDDATYQAVHKTTSGFDAVGFVWEGSLKDVPGGHVTLVVNGQALAATVSLPGLLYRIKDTGLGAHIVEQVPTSDPMPESQPIPVASAELGEPSLKPLVDLSLIHI